MNFPDIMSATCDTRLPIPLSTFGIDFWNRLNLTIAMAGHLFRHSTSTIGTTTLPNIYMCGANCKIIDICKRLEDASVIADLDPPRILTPTPSKSANGYGPPFADLEHPNKVSF